ncbi:MAG TPA: hypothetical protein VK966_03615, partial [Longimicrobiales bacterium]|nr:hypothetical protein [Longimicrobiales bacterium]
ANAPGDTPEAERVASGSLSYEEANDLITRLREGGVHPAPTEKQMNYFRELVEDLELGPDELQELTGVRDPDDVRSSVQASAAIDELRRVFEERRPPSQKQRRFIDDLIKEAELSEADAARLVGLTSLDELTGGSEGTASELIDRLQELTREKKEAGAS